ncbi:short-chain dehydrogenase [Sphingomonas oleivorans]|uniref:Short-chain dehydrogenase n=1 Tax=Sphingomonas oleivorans TaxID=1735121 RepID=A0A2T5G201_9SPHN|nr:SDR family oxidoreductase [Sphingomonas oleivorans]PTQ13183.1 short-chain dehydrogenase [Sphingomonas oleivorans]
MGKLDGQIALVTGASSGIGKATAIEFAREGASIFILYHKDDAEAEAVKSEIEALGARCATGRADVGSEPDILSAFAACAQKLGTPTILVNNAGIDSAGIHVADMTLDRWNETIRTNLTGPFLCSREFVRGRQSDAGAGKIINISSVHQDIPRAGAADYDASKGGLRNLTTTLALELAPLKINVNNIAPGMVLTQMNQEAIDNPKIMEEQIASIPWKRAADPKEIARLAVYLASQDADYVTGATFVIDGGLMLNMGQGA